MITEQEILLRLFLAACISGLIGWEREIHERPAGFRTHILVCMGATLVMMLSLNVHKMFGDAADPGRIAAQVVSGIGFLGAGTIIREGVSVRGLTTAASLWAVAGIGLAIGAGMYFASFFTAGLVFVSLWYLSKLEFRAASKLKYRMIRIKVTDQPGILGELGSTLGELKVNIIQVNMEQLVWQGTMVIEFKIQLPQGTDTNLVTRKLAECKGVLQIEWAKT